LSVVTSSRLAPTATPGRRRLRPVATLLTVLRNACGLTPGFSLFPLFFAISSQGVSA